VLCVFRMERGTTQTQPLYMAFNLCHVQAQSPAWDCRVPNAAARIMLVLQEGLAIAP
jgi:hypothetical protein